MPHIPKLLSLFFLISSTTHSFPLNQTENEEEALVVNVLWTSVERKLGESDLIRPSLCPSPCDRLFHGRRIDRVLDGMDEPTPSEEECYCRCPEEMPVFMQRTGRCVAKIGWFLGKENIETLTITPRRLPTPNSNSQLPLRF
jgi:hypothetical protein